MIWIDEVITHIQLHSEKISVLYKRLSKLQKEEPNINHAALARHIIEEDILP